jgi:thymidylate synthase (FAD)
MAMKPEHTSTPRVRKPTMSTSCEFKNTIDVELVGVLASDLDVIQAARVSTRGSDSSETNESEQAGLINFLMRNRHGSPFEHNMFKFRVTAPIFVWREHHRHRIGFSYNEESGRYKQLNPVFYIPGVDRDLVQTGKPGAYVFGPGSQSQVAQVTHSLIRSNTASYGEYELLLKLGIAKEVARMVLPVNIFSTVYVTMNARSLMNFLSLRTHDDSSTFPSFPMREIEMVAEHYEMAFAHYMPLTLQAFNKNGRVAP